MYGITYNDKHSYKDFDVTILKNRTIEVPVKNKVVESVPFMNGNYDFSNLYGSPTYSNRKLEYTFLIKAKNSTLLEIKKIQLDIWLYGTNEKTPLVDDNLKGFYYLAECVDSKINEETNTFMTVTYTFEAYPFRIGDTYEGNNLWDSFNFEIDILQDTSFNVDGTKTVDIYNTSSIDIEPTIIASSSFEIIRNGKTFKVNAGEYKGFMFRLKKGNNKLTLKGNGTIEFKFRKEVL